MAPHAVVRLWRAPISSPASLRVHPRARALSVVRALVRACVRLIEGERDRETLVDERDGASRGGGGGASAVSPLC